MKAYKGFNKDGTCRGFKFEEGQTYREDKAKLCRAGFHACEDPLDCLQYYAPGSSDYREVELEEVSPERQDDSKVCAKVIKIGAKISVRQICDLHFDFVRSKCTTEKSGGDESSLSGGDRSSLSGGDRSSLSGGDESSLSGGYRSSLSGGDRSVTAGMGSASVGKNGLAVVRGNGCKVRGGIGAVLVIAEERHISRDIDKWRAVVVDGEQVKPDTWYTLQNGELVEADT